MTVHLIFGKMRVIVRESKISPRNADFPSFEGTGEKLSDEIDFLDDDVLLEVMPYQKQNKDLFTHGFIS